KSPYFLRDALKPVTVQIRHSRHGPIISDLFGVFDQPVALHWTGLDDGDTSYEAFFKLNYASNWQTFSEALSHHVAPTLNMLYADKTGNIGYLGMGKIPLRQQGEGTFPVPGWNELHRWNGYIPSAKMPQSYNPDSGYIVSANNKVVGPQYPYFISHHWAAPARAERISQLLEQKISAKSLMTSEDMGIIQGDTMNLAAQRLLPLLTVLKSDDETEQQAIDAMKQWQGDMAHDSAEATIFYSWLRHLKMNLLNDELQMSWGLQVKSNFLDSIVADVHTVEIQRALNQDDNVWCDNVTTKETESCQQILLISLQDAIKETSKILGSDLSDWQWGEVHTTVYSHQPFSQVKFLDSIFERRISSGGSPESINVASAKFDITDGYVQRFGPGFRQIMAWQADGISHRYMNSTGQSGNVMSRHYDDMVDPFNAVEFEQLTDKTAAAESQLSHLLPKQ
ncbi:MAG: penicillin acylase family protein, partial [Psychrosphaera sp.]|nr:penicillin acylase family protein [Psychrosphaera sp.]